MAGSEGAFGARDPLDARVHLAGGVDRLGERLEHPFRHVVRVPTVQNLHMQVHPGMHRESPQKLLHELERESTHGSLGIPKRAGH